MHNFLTPEGSLPPMPKKTVPVCVSIISYCKLVLHPQVCPIHSIPTTAFFYIIKYKHLVYPEWQKGDSKPLIGHYMCAFIFSFSHRLFVNYFGCYYCSLNSNIF